MTVPAVQSGARTPAEYGARLAVCQKLGEEGFRLLEFGPDRVPEAKARQLYAAAAQDFAAGRFICDKYKNPLSHEEEQRRLGARLALCAAVANELPSIRRGESVKDAIVLANQYNIGEKAGGATVGHEWFAYKDGEWHDRDCYALSVAKWALAEGYGGDPIHLPDGAIGQVIQP